MTVTDVKRKVETTFTIKDRATGAAGMLGRNMKSVGASIGGVLKVLNPLNLALGSLGLGFAAAGVAKLGNQFEQTQMQMAGFLSALGITSNFNQGLKLAESTIESIRISAAQMPGEAEDYIEIFRAGLPALQGAVGGSIQEMTAFSNKYAAITKTLGVDSMQAARDMALMLRSGIGGAGADVRSFMVLMPFLKKVEGQANLTAKAFNLMTQPERAAILGKAFTTLQPMLDHASNTFDAIWGGFKSNTRMVTRLGTAPLFESMKNTLKAVNTAMFTTTGQMTPLTEKLVHIGTLISKGIGGAFGFVIEQVKKLGGVFDKIAQSDAFSSLKYMIEEGISGAIASPGKAAAAGGGVLAVLAGASGPMGILIAGLIEFGTRTEAISGIFDTLSMLTAGLMIPLSQLSGALLQVSGLIADVLEGALGGLIDGLAYIISPLAVFAGGMVQLAGEIIGKLRPTFMLLWTAAGNLFRSLGVVLNPIIRISGAIMMKFYRVAADFLVPIITTVVTWLSKFVDALAEIITTIGGWLGKVASVVEKGLEPGGGRSNKDKEPHEDWFAKLMEMFKTPAKGETDAAGGMAGISTPSARGGGGRSVNDFRYSRFTIDQKFAEGFDPDRIAVAFAQDLGKIGEQRLQSGFEPLFSVS